MKVETTCKEGLGDNCKVDTTEKDLGNSSQLTAIVPNSNTIEEIGEDLSLFDKEKSKEKNGDLSLLDNENIEEMSGDLSLFDNHNENTEEISGDLSPFVNEKTYNLAVLGTPPPPQAGLKLLHKAPRVGLSRQQKLTRLHPYKTQ